MQAISRYLVAPTMLIILLMPAFAFAQVKPKENFKNVLQEAGLVQGNPTDVEKATGLFINRVLIFMGTAAFAVVIYAGGLWVFAAGNEEQITKAKKILYGAVLGLIIIFSAYVIVAFVLDLLAESL